MTDVSCASYSSLSYVNLTLSYTKLSRGCSCFTPAVLVDPVASVAKQETKQRQHFPGRNLDWYLWFPDDVTSDFCDPIVISPAL